MNIGRHRNTILPYVAAIGAISADAPSSTTTLSMKAMPRTEQTTPVINVAQAMSENARFAPFPSPTPRSCPTTALPPEPIMMPNADRITVNGKTMVIEASASLPTRLETNRPSMMPYAELTNIMAMVGSVYFNSLLFVKCCERTSMPLIPLTIVTVL